ncbi:MAG: tetratricopeptide repeat protein [Alphaproteobacteria bacterium]|nr:tetratricopeptide repeat protein [Alphaproteobacteria bacterium]
MSDIFTEVEEDLRRERAKALWTRYGRYFVAVAVIAILAVGAHTWWRSYERSQQLEAADRYQAVLAQQGQAGPASVAADLEALADAAPDGYRMTALMRAAALHGEAGDHAAAAQTFERVAADDGVDRLYRDLAEVLAVSQAARAGDRDPADLLGRLAPHLEAGAAWRFTALEVAAGLALQAGDVDTAREHLSAIADSADAPQRSRARAAEILSAVGE